MHDRAFRPPVRLAGKYVELVPLERSHATALTHAARDPESQRYLIEPAGPSVAETLDLIERLLARQESGTDLPFTTRLRSDGSVVGMTRYLRMEPENDGVEIGGTYLDSRWWRSPLNTDAKLAMLRHAFDVGGAHRVALRTDLRNLRSQTAIARLGAVREGLLREHVRLRDGSYRTSVVFSILVAEWPAVRDRLAAALDRPWSGRPAT